ncbi:transglycosylase SLT domain-containing protein [Acetobacter fallax]|nr:transglycosylase SLT domain-containing protein [Acetobacter fallax]
MSRASGCLLQSFMLALLATLAACSGTSRPGGDPSEWGRGDYRAPGSASDPWGPYIREAAGRFSVPEPWIRAVMNQESGGKEYRSGRLTRSGSGAIGLMQLMPSTWSELAGLYSLGRDPYEPHDNIVAGTGYIRQLYDRFGSPGFLAAYNAGPGRLEQYLQTGGSLPDETVNYVASISPHLGDVVPAAGAIASESAPVQVALASRAAPVLSPASDVGSMTRTADGCLRDADAAYDSSNCLMDHDTPHANPVAAPQPVAPPLAVASALPPPLPVELASYVEPASVPNRVAAQPAVATTGYSYSAAGGRPWAVQVGAFSSGSDARVALAQAQTLIGTSPGRLGAVVTRVSPSAHSLFRARLVGFGAQDAAAACRVLHTHSIACFTVPVTI